MATQIIIYKRKKSLKLKQEAEHLAAQQDKELPAFSNGKRQPRAHRSASLDSDTSDTDIRFAQMGLEDGLTAVEEQDQSVISRVYDLVRETRRRQESYCNLFAFLLFTAVYMIVLYMQQNSALVYQLTTASSALLPQSGSFTYASDIYTYLNDTFVQTIWADPQCGDGICDRPIEFSGFGRFGCTPDCGPMDTVPITVSFTTEFKTAQDQDESEWNVCMTYPDHLCWFDANQKFADRTGAFQTTLNLPNGTWEVRITAPTNGVSGKTTTTILDPLGLPEAITLSSWGACVRDAESDLLRCRSLCARSVGCAVDACSNLDGGNLAGLFVDCTGLCNANFTALDLYQNLNCVQIVNAANDTKRNSFFTASGRSCILDPAYVAAHPEQSAPLAPPANAPLPAQHSDSTGGRRRVSRRLSQLTNGTQLYWEQFGQTDVQRFGKLATALSRALNTWVIDSCLAKYYMPPATTGPPMLGFFCAYFGGPPTLPGCSYVDPATNRTLTSADVDALHGVLKSRYGAASRYNISQPEQDRFIDILVNALSQTIGFTLSDSDLINLDTHLHKTDAEIVRQETNKCNFVYVVLPWKLDVHYVTNVTVGDSIQFVWADELPHAIKGLNIQDSADIFNGFGTGRRVISTGSLCTPENVGAGEAGSFATDPVPCIVRTDNVLQGATSKASFSVTQVFRQPGVFQYVGARFRTSMTGTIYVSPANGALPNTVTAEDQRECAPGCPIRFLSNGRCGAALGCNSVECAFDGGDCACPDPATVLATASISSSSYSDLCKCSPGQIRSDDGTCCQVETIGQDFRSSFDVVITSNQESLFDPSNHTRTRYATNHNRVIGGLFLKQTRFGGKMCKDKRFLNLFQVCIDGHKTTPFGIDPVFVPTSSLYNPDQQANIGQFYTPDEVSPLGAPFGFYSKDLGAHGNPGFPLVFDINLDQAGAQTRLQALVDGLFLDNATDTVVLQMVTYNGENRFFVDTEIRLTFQRAGKIAVNTDINAVNVELYQRPADYVLAGLEIIVALAILYAVYKELMEAVSIWREKGSFRPYFAIPWNYIDLASLALLLSAVVMRIYFVAYLAPSFHAAPRYDIYESLTQPARFFQLKKDSQLTDFTELLERVHYLISYDAIYAGINGVNIFFMILRILKHMHFQPRMGVLTRTLVEAGPDILNFFILWTLVFLGYSFMGHLVFGRSIEYFRSLGWSITSCFLLILGDTTFEYELMTLQGWEFGAGQFFFWTFNWFIVFIIMNFLIAIAVDAFVDVKDKTESAPTMPAELAEYAYMYIHSFGNKRLSKRSLFKLLKAWRKKQPKVVNPKLKDLDTHDEDEKEAEEHEVVLKVDNKNVDKETLQCTFERRNQLVDHSGSAANYPELVARQVMLEYGEEVKKTAKQPKKAKKNAELLELKGAVANLELRVRDIGDLLHSRLDAIHRDMVVSGLSRSIIPEGRESESEDDGMDRGDEESHSVVGRPSTRRLFDKP